MYQSATSGSRPSASRPIASDPCVLLVADRVEAVQDVGRLPQRQPEVGPVDRDVGEADDGPSGSELRRQARRVRLDPGQGDACLDAPLHLHELDLHVDGRFELRLFAADPPQLEDLRRVGARTADGTLAHSRHSGPTGARAQWC